MLAAVHWDEVSESLAAAATYLGAELTSTGCWREFQGKSRWGPSTSWVTAWSAQLLPATKAFSELAKTACRFLVKRQRSTGWGFNERVPCDVDSTAWAILALVKHGFIDGAEVSDYQTLINRYSKGDGFCLYRETFWPRILGMLFGSWGLIGWNSPNEEITNLARAAKASLAKVSSQGLRLQHHVAELRETPVPSYWWESDVYPVFTQALLAGECGRPLHLSRRALADVDEKVPLWLSLAAIASRGTEEGRRRARALLQLQNTNGSWRSGPILRIPSAAAEQQDLHRHWKIDRPGPWSIWSETTGILSTSAAISAIYGNLGGFE